MLILSRRRDEVLMIGPDVEVTVVDIRGDRTRLGVVAPKDLAVHRKEIYERIGRHNLARPTPNRPHQRTGPAAAHEVSLARVDVYVPAGWLRSIVQERDRLALRLNALDGGDRKPASAPPQLRDALGDILRPPQLASA